MGNAKKIFGEFPRDQITETSDFPTRVFGQIETADSICTGTLIGPKHIITAAHCVYDQENAEWSKEVKFFPGRINKETTPYGEVKASRFYIHRNYMNEETSVGYDYAVIELESPIGDEIGWAGMSVPSTDMTEFSAQVTGYPGDKEFGTLWGVECPAQIIENNQIRYRCDTFGGMSGSAVRSSDETRMIIGVHTFGSENVNGGWLINSERFAFLMSWLKNENITEETVTHDNYFPPKDNFDKINFRNNCDQDVRVIAHYVDLNGNWVSDGSWRIEPGVRAYVFNTRNTIFYYFAISDDSENIWQGDYSIDFHGRSFPMRKKETDIDGWGEYTVNLNCN